MSGKQKLDRLSKMLSGLSFVLFVEGNINHKSNLVNGKILDHVVAVYSNPMHLKISQVFDIEPFILKGIKNLKKKFSKRLHTNTPLRIQLISGNEYLFITRINSINKIKESGEVGFD